MEILTAQDLEDLTLWLAEDCEQEAELLRYLACRCPVAASLYYRRAAPFACACSMLPDPTPSLPAFEAPALPQAAPKAKSTPLRIISRTLSSLVIVILILAISAVLIPRVFGIQMRAVLTASMEPVYHVGSLVIIAPKAFNEIKVGDDITFVRNKKLTVVTHRVVEKNAGTNSFTTQGLTNNTADAPVSYDNVLGKVVYTIPKLGYPLLWMDSVANKIIAITVIAAAWLTFFLLERALNQKKKQAQPGADV